MQKEIAWLLKEKYNGLETAAFEKDVARLAKGEPVDYVIGFTEFLGCKIDLSKKPLIPRPETEFWVQEAIKDIYYKNESFPKRSIWVLDMFSGSGCIGVSIVRQIDGAHVVFADKEKKCVEQIKINCKLNRLDKKQYKIVQSDIFSKIKGKPALSRAEGFDYIFANPPYIPVARKSKIQKSVLAYEPSAALFGGEDGLVVIRRFLAAAKNRLNENGKIYMEFDPPQKSAIAVLLKKLKYQAWDFHKDQYGKVRYVVVQ